MKLVASGGGTGGHVYPALTVLQNLIGSPVGPAMAPDDVLWVGSKGGIEEELVTRAGFQFVGLAAGGLRGMGWGVRVRNALQIAGSVLEARRLLRRFRPDVVLSTGGYASVAVTVAAWLARIPLLIYLPDVMPGQAIRMTSRLAVRVAVTSEESYRYLPRDRVVVTGYPVRPEIMTLNKTDARRLLGLDETSDVLLVFGGSRGARSINQALEAGLRELLPVCQVVHISGQPDAGRAAAAAAGLPDELRGRYHPFPYLHDMPAALAAADLAVARAGAATLGEFPAAALPAILVPYPYSGQHQDPNAAYLAHNGAARVIRDAELAEKLIPAILELLSDEGALAGMQEAARAMARPDAADAIAEQVRLLARREKGRTEARR